MVQKFEFEFPSFFQMSNFEYHIFLDYFLKYDLSTTSQHGKNGKIVINDQMKHFINMDYEFEISL